MKKLILFLMFIMILIVPLVYGQIETLVQENTTNLWQSDVDLTTDNSTNDLTAQLFGTPTLDTSNFQVGSGSANFDGLDEGINFSDPVFNEMINFSVGCWIKGEKTNDVMRIASRQEGDSGVVGEQWTFFYDDRDGFGDNIKFDIVGRISIAHNFPEAVNGTFNHVAITVNASGNDLTAILYINGTFASRTVGAGSFIKTDTPYIIGSHSGDTLSRSWKGNLDECFLLNYTASQVAINSSFQLGKNGTPIESAVAPADIDPPVITFFPPTPDNNSFESSVLITINVSITDASVINEIILNFNGTNETGFINGSTNFFSKTVNTMAEGLFTYQLFANDSEGNSVTTGTFQFTVDNTTPAIVYNFPLTDNSTVSKVNGNVDIRAFNINLNSSNLTVFNSSNQIVFQNLTNLSQPNFNMTDPISNILTGEPDDTYRFRACFVDNGGLETCQEALFILDNTNPVASIVLSNNTPEETSVIQINGSCTDANGIQLLTIENNVSGTFTNVTTRNLNNVTSIIHIFNHTAVLGTISHKVTCEDGVLNSDQSVNLIYNSTETPTDTTPPTATLAIGNITPLEGSTVQFNATCSDASGIKFVTIENNASGIFTNVSSTTPGNSSPFTHIFNHTAVLGTISHKATCVDGVDNSAQSEILNYTSTALPVVEVTELPLSRVVQIGGMLVLILIVLGSVFGLNGGKFKK